MRIVVVDDDPTGMQTVHGCLVLTRWDRETLERAFEDDCRFFFVLTNTRAYDAATAEARAFEVATRVLDVAAVRNESIMFISRGDSTLRGHFPTEINAMNRALIDRTDTSADVVLLVPAFIEGGRVTEGAIHFVHDAEGRRPVTDTEFANDSVFGYASADLRAYIEEKTGGAVKAGDVRHISRERLEAGEPATLDSLLVGTSGNPFVVSDAVDYEHLDALAGTVERAMSAGVLVLAQSGASFVKAVTHTPSVPLAIPDSFGGEGIVVVGSHVRKSTRQLKRLLDDTGTRGIEVDVESLLSHADAVNREVLKDISDTWQNGRTPVVYTSRNEMRFGSSAERLQAGQRISDFLVTLLHELGDQPSYVIAKGGITAHDLLVHGTGVSHLRALGQIEPGVPILRIPAESALANKPFVVFPGNVGDDEALYRVWRRLQYGG